MPTDRAFDVAVLGGGLLGCFAARNLAKYDLRVALVEAREDVCTGISRSNTAIVYTGYDTKPDTLKTQLCVRACREFGALCGALGVPFARRGSLLISYGPRADRVLEKKLAQGRENGVKNLALLSGGEAEALEPGLAPGVSAALYAPGTGTVDPWALCFAAYENALQNGCVPFLNTKVTGLVPEESGYRLLTTMGELQASAVVNCCGLYADEIQELIAPPSVRIVPQRADYLLLDETAGGFVRHIVFHEPEAKGKGLTLVPTVDGKLLLGPSEQPGAGKASFATTPEGLSFLTRLAGQVVPGLDLSQTIRSFGAVRPNPFHVRLEHGVWQTEDKSIGNFTVMNPLPRFWSLIGIKTPGLTCADALGADLAERVAADLGRTGRNPAFSPVRRPPTRVKELGGKDRTALVSARPEYGKIVCRCNGITEGEVLEAIARGAVTLDGIKRRVGTGLGRCQGGFCADRIMQILSRALGVPPEALTKDGPGTAWLAPGSVRRAHKPEPPSPPPPALLDRYDLLVVGGGAAGMAAALAASAGGGSILLVDRESRLGGVLPQCVHSGFGLGYFQKSMTGPEYAAQFMNRLAASPVQVLLETTVLAVDRAKTAVLSGPAAGYRRIAFEKLILATGCRETPIGALPIAGTRPAGIFTAGQAQRMVNLEGLIPGREIVILGSGDIGLIMARRLTLNGCHVAAVLEQRDRCGGMLRNYRECIEAFQIPLITRATVTKIHGEGRISGVTVRHLDSGAEAFCPCDTLITAVGLVPERELLSPLGEPLPGWAALCGNCDYVHEIVDAVTIQAEALGRSFGRIG